MVPPVTIQVYSHRPLRAMLPSRCISGWLMIRPSKRLTIWSRTFAWEQKFKRSYRWYVLMHGCLCPQRHPMSNPKNAFIEFWHDFLKKKSLVSDYVAIRTYVSCDDHLVTTCPDSWTRVPRPARWFLKTLKVNTSLYDCQHSWIEEEKTPQLLEDRGC